MNEPMISVIMPVYNGEKYIAVAIESILNQTYTDFELILIDDCGTDRSMEIALDYAEKDERIRVIHNPKNMGIAYSRNVGLDNSRGKYIAIMDDDDYSFAYRFEKQVTFLEKNTDYGVLGGAAQWIDENGNVTKPEVALLTDRNYIKAMFLFFNLFNNSEVMFRKEIVERHQIRYEDNLLGMEDFKFWIRMSKVTYMTNIDELLLQHRMISDNETSRVMANKREERKQLFAQLQRYSLELSGFSLDEEKLEVLNRVLNEDGTATATSKRELMKLYEAFYELIMQAREMKLDITDAIEHWFRNIYVDKVALMSAENMWD